MRIKHRQAKLLIVGEEGDFVQQVRIGLLENVFLARLSLSGRRDDYHYDEYCSYRLRILGAEFNKEFHGITGLEFERGMRCKP